MTDTHALMIARISNGAPPLTAAQAAVITRCSRQTARPDSDTPAAPDVTPEPIRRAA